MPNQITSDEHLRAIASHGNGCVLNSDGNILHIASCAWLKQANLSTPKYHFDSQEEAETWLDKNRSGVWKRCGVCMSGDRVSTAPRQAREPTGRASATPTVFVAMPFSDEMWPVWEAIEAAAKGCSARALRVDLIPQVNNIHDAIFKAIENSDVLVADLTGANANVAMEVQHARHHQKPLVLITQNANDLPFDLRVFRAIVYTNTPSGMDILGKRLLGSIGACLPQPYKASPDSDSGTDVRARATVRLEEHSEAGSAVEVDEKPEVRWDNKVLASDDIPGFTYLREDAFECGGIQNTVAIYQFDEFASAGADGPSTEFALLPGGEFMMGSRDRPEEQPVHLVHIRPFLMARTQVTQEVWQAFMGSNPSRFRGPRLPVDNISWVDAQEFCGKTGFRLPSESEWEYACLAGSEGKWCFGDDNTLLAEYEWYNLNFGGKTHDVATRKANSFGLYDMNGNVMEWCLDTFHASYEGAPSDERAWVSSGGTTRALRGGYWGGAKEFCRSRRRSKRGQNERISSAGVRFARSVS